MSKGLLVLTDIYCKAFFSDWVAAKLAKNLTGQYYTYGVLTRVLS